MFATRSRRLQLKQDYLTRSILMRASMEFLTGSLRTSLFRVSGRRPDMSESRPMSGTAFLSFCVIWILFGAGSVNSMASASPAWTSQNLDGLTILLVESQDHYGQFEW